MLTAYTTDTLDLLHDPNSTYFSTTQVTNYINRARNRIAGRSQSVRILLSGGVITAISILSGGSGYSGTATVTISGAGQQAQATATISGGAVNSITLVNGGWGYITGTTTTVEVTGSGGGSNATFTVTTDNSLTTVPGQEVYQFSTANTLAADTSGVLEVMAVFSVACAWGANAAMKPLLIPKIWTEFQAYFRSYNTGMESFPTIWSQYAQGVMGSIYLWPLPSQYSQMDWDCSCLPVALVTDSTPEAIPYPWQAAVPYYAAELAFRDAQRPDDAKTMHAEFERRMQEAVTMSTMAFVPDYYESDF